MTNLTYTYTIKEGKSVEEFISMVDIFLQSSENMETQRNSLSTVQPGKRSVVISPGICGEYFDRRRMNR